MNTFKDNNMMKVAVIAVLLSAHSVSRMDSGKEKKIVLM